METKCRFLCLMLIMSMITENNKYLVIKSVFILLYLKYSSFKFAINYCMAALLVKFRHLLD